MAPFSNLASGNLASGQSSAPLRKPAVPYSLVLVPGTNADAFSDQIQEISTLTDDGMYDVLIVNRGLSGLVTSLLGQIEGSVEVVSADSTMSWAEICNQVASQAAGDRLIFLSPDARLYPGWLRYINEAFTFDPNLSVVRSADSEIVAVAPSTFASLRGFNVDSRAGNEVSDFCVLAASRGERIGFDRKAATGVSKLRWQFMTDGYIVLKNFVDPDICDRIIAEGEAYYASKGVNPYEVNRVMNFHQVSPTAKAHLTGERFNAVLRELFAEDPLFLQTILFYEGSQQDLHSDWIYMSTNRHHRLMGTWLALEDVHNDAGPLRYLPGSQKLQIESISERWDRMRPAFERDKAMGNIQRPTWAGPNDTDAFLYMYDGWEGGIGPSALASGYKEQRFLADKGDILCWHANLIHGGTKIERPGSTRRSIVAHYLTHEISEYYDINLPNGVRQSAQTAAHNALNVVPELRTKKPR